MYGVSLGNAASGTKPFVVTWCQAWRGWVPMLFVASPSTARAIHQMNPGDTTGMGLPAAPADA